jgi:diguanylate cyclase (GGDEF)-like protein
MPENAAPLSALAARQTAETLDSGAGDSEGGEAFRLSAAADILKQTFDGDDRGFLLLDARMRVRGFNPRLGELIGLPEGVLCEGASAFSLVSAAAALGYYGAKSAEEEYVRWTRRLAGRTAGQHRSHSSNGRTTKVRVAPFGEGEWVIFYEDISRQSAVEEALELQNERFDAALTNIPHGVCMFDSRIRLVLCNAAYAKLYALPPELTAAGTTLRQILDYRRAAGNAPVDETTYFDFSNEAEAIRHVKSNRVLLADGRTVRIAHNPMSGGGYVATHEDVTETVRVEEQIRYLASHDGLTGLPNRAQLLARVDEALGRGRRGESFGLHYLDLDNFKIINDAQGHPAGDLLLKLAAGRMRTCLSPGDMLARIGGDEFVVLQAGLETPEQAGELAGRLVAAMAEPFDLEGRQAFIGLSAGISVYPGDGTNARDLLKNADLAMYRSKSEGRNTFRFFELAMDARVQERRLLELDLRRALANEEFEIYYQPQVDATTETIVGCEALLRWHHPTRGMVAPGEFIPLAEEIGVIVPLGAWVLHRACRDAAAWPAAVGVAVNLSSHQFKGLSLYQSVVSALDASGLSPARLELEITESVLLANTESTIATLKLLRAMGVRIAMDDFGTGYSSLSYLRSFPFDKLKIDRSFIKDFGEDNENSAIVVRAVASLGAALGMTTTAEGVETVEQLRLIRSLGCDEVQGYYFGRPCPAGELTALFDKAAAAA